MSFIFVEYVVDIILLKFAFKNKGDKLLKLSI